MERPHMQKEKSLAWFKLADLIARGEREKALSVFRLLAHSLPDRAYVLQLEGDILWYLDDKNAAEKYKQAAFLYQKDKRWIDAIAIYEHLLTHDPRSCDILASLLIFYAMLDWPEKFQERYQILLELFQQRVIDEFQLEKCVKEVIETVKAADDTPKTWLFEKVSVLVKHLPDNVASRLAGLL